MPYADPERAKTERRRYYLANRAHLIELQTARRHANPDYAKEYNAAHRGHIAAHSAAKLASRRAYVAEMKARPCIDCGGRFPPECMDFDHVRGEKVADISKMLLRSTDLLHDEIAKCDVVCANCHRIRTHRRPK
jgi:hypothetical protein